MRKIISYSSLLLLLAIALPLIGCGDSGPAQPARQAEFGKLLQQAKQAEKTATTELKQQQAAQERQQALSAFADSDISFTDWIMTVDEVSSHELWDLGSRKNIVLLSVANDAYRLLNQDNALLGLPEGAIEEGSQLYAAIAGLDKGASVLVSGHFVTRDQNQLREAEDDSPLPAFVVIFTDVKPVAKP